MDSGQMSCNGTIDSVILFPGELPQSEIRGVLAMPKPAQQYSMADYRQDCLDNDGTITPSEKLQALSYWKSIYNDIALVPLTAISTRQEGDFSAIITASVSSNSNPQNYISATNNLRDFLFGTNGILLSMNVNSVVTPGIYDSLLSSYRARRQELQTAISSGTSLVVVENETGNFSPKYLGKFLDSAPSANNLGDVYTRYSTTSGSTNRGVFKWDGTEWVRTEARSDIMQAGSDIGYIIAYKNTASPPVAIYGTAADYTSESTIQSDFAFFQAAFIGFLEAEAIKVRNKIYSGAGNYDNEDTPLFIGADGLLSLYNASIKLKGNRTYGFFPNRTRTEEVTALVKASEFSVSSNSGTTTLSPIGINIEGSDNFVSEFSTERAISKNFFTKALSLTTNWQTILSTYYPDGFPLPEKSTNLYDFEMCVMTSSSESFTIFRGSIIVSEIGGTNITVNIDSVLGFTSVIQNDFIRVVNDGSLWELQVKTLYNIPYIDVNRQDYTNWCQLRCLGRAI